MWTNIHISPSTSESGRTTGRGGVCSRDGPAVGSLVFLTDACWCSTIFACTSGSVMAFPLTTALKQLRFLVAFFPQVWLTPSSERIQCCWQEELYCCWVVGFLEFLVEELLMACWMDALCRDWGDRFQLCGMMIGDFRESALSSKLSNRESRCCTGDTLSTVVAHKLVALTVVDALERSKATNIQWL